MDTKKKINSKILALIITIVIAITGISGYVLAKYVFNKQNEAEINFYEYRIAESEIVISPEEYTGEEVTVTITTEKPGLSIQYKLGDSDEWIDYTGPFSVDENTKIDARLVAEDFKGPVTEKDITNIAVCKIGDTYYKTLESAINACADNAGNNQTKIEMLTSVTENVIIPAGKNIILDLNGKTVASKKNTNETPTIIVEGKFNLIDSAKDGKVESSEGTAIKVSSTGSFTIGTNENEPDVKTNPVIIGETYGVEVDEGGELNFYDGEIRGKTNAIKGNVTATPKDYGVVTKTDGLYEVATLGKIYTVKFDANGGTPNPEDKRVILGKNYGFDATSKTKKALPEVTRTGYKFLGWIANFEEKTSETITATTIVTYAGDHTLKADWQANEYTLSYNSNGGTGKIDDVKCSYDGDITIAKNTLTAPKGYTFKEWNTKQDGTGTAYAQETVTKNLTSVDGDTVTLYAIWEDKTEPSKNAPTGTSTTNTITVDCNQKDEGSGIDETTIEYAIYKDGKWSDWQTSNTFDGLQGNTEYQIKTRATDKDGNGPTESDVATVKTKNIKIGTMVIHKDSEQGEIITPKTDKDDKTEPINNDIYVDIKPAETGTTTVKVKAPNGETTSYTEDTKITTKTGTYEITIETTDGTNTVTETTYVFVDKTVPTVNPSTEATTNSVKVDANAEDIDSGVKEIKYVVKQGDTIVAEITKTKDDIDKTIEVPGLKDNTEYNVEITVVDNAGNTTNTNIIAKTNELIAGKLDFTESETNTKFVPATSDKDSKIWVNENVKTAMTKGNAGTTKYTVQKVGETTKKEYSTDTEIATTDGDYIVTLETTDGTNTKTVTYYFSVDKTKPTVTINPNGQNYTIPVNNNKVNISVTLTPADNQNGSGVAVTKYAWSTDNNTEPNSWTDFVSGTPVTNTANGGVYYLWTKVVDNAGNEATSIKVSKEYNVGYEVKFDVNGGTGSIESQRKIHKTNLTLTNQVPTKDGYIFKGWADDKTKTTPDYTSSSIYSKDESITLYAVWSEVVASATVNGVTTNYDSVQNAINSLGTNKGTVTLIKGEIQESVAVANGQDVTLDTAGKTLTSDGTTITNNGTLIIQGEGIINSENRAIMNSSNLTIEKSTIKSNKLGLYNTGKITVNDSTIETKGMGIQNYEDFVFNSGFFVSEGQYTISNNKNVTISGGTIENKYTGSEANHTIICHNRDKINGTYECITNVNITGGLIKEPKKGSGFAITTSNSYTNGTITVSGGIIESNNNSGINNHKGKTNVSGGTISSIGTSTGNINITGGTIKKGVSVNDAGTLTMGTKDSTVSIVNPIVKGGVYIVKTGKFNFYDGIIKAPSGQTLISGDVTDTPEGYSVVNGSEVIDSVTYDTAYLDNHYTVTFDYKDGTGDVKNKTVTYGETYGELPTTTKTGYTFGGWTDSDGNIINETTKVSQAKNHTLTAKWTANKYTITFDADGGTVTPEEKEVTYDETYGELPLPEKTGYTFTGWKDANGKAYTSDETVKITANTTLIAEWEANKYLVSFDANGGTVDTDEKEVTYNQAYGELPTPTKSGYTFDGWKNTEIGNVTESTIVKTTKNHTLIAKWTIINYTLTFDTNGGKYANNKTNPTTYTVEDKITLNPVTKEGYVFVGWKLSTLDGKNVENSEIINEIPLGTIGNRAYVAVFNNGEVSYRIHHMLENANDNGYTEYNTEIVSNLKGTTTPVKTGDVITLDDKQAITISNATYEKSTDTKDGEQGTSVTVSADGSTEIYIYYKRNRYELTVNAGENTKDAKGTGTYKYGETVDISASYENLVGYTYSDFAWTTTDTSILASTTAKSTTLVMPGAAVTVTATAKKTVNQYTISYILNDGTVDGTNPTTYDVETSDITLINPTKIGYTFTGWTGTDLSSASTKVVIAKGSTGNRAYTANWTVNNYILNKVGLNDNLIVNGDFEDYSIINNQIMKTINGVQHTWDGNLNGVPDDPTKSYYVTGWGTGLNNGVEVPEIGYHAHMRIIDGNNVFVLKTNEEYAGKTKADVADGESVVDKTIPQNRWLAVSQIIDGKKLQAGKLYTISMDIYRAEGGSIITCGLYYSTNSDSQRSFKSGLGSMRPSQIGKWETFSYTFRLDEDYLDTINPIIYIYGYYANIPGKLYIDNVRLEEVTDNTKISKEYNTTYTAEELAIPTKTGYTFQGWYSTTSLTTTDIFNKDNAYFRSITTPDSNAYIYAKWKTHSYTIKYDGNGATSGEMASSSQLYDDTITLTQNEFVRTGYTFKGWATKPDATTAEYTDKQSVSQLVSEDNGEITLYAVWAINDYTVTYDYGTNGGQVSETDTTKTATAQVTYGKSIDLTKTAYKAGYTFLGWSESADSINVVKTATMGAANKTYYAVFAKLEVDPSSIEIDLSKNTTQAITITGENYGTLTYTTNNSEVVTVAKNTDNQNAVATFKKNGNTTITVKSSVKDFAGKNLSATISVIVKTTPTKLTLNPTSAIIGVKSNNTVSVIPTITPETANAENNVTFTSNNSNIAKVDSSTGVVTGLAEGTAIITAKTTNGQTATSTITVDATAPTVTVTMDNTSYKKSHTATIAISDDKAGLPATQTISYAWSTSSTTAPITWQTKDITTTAGTKTVRTTVTKNGVTGTQYLWVKNGIKDNFDNATTVNATATAKFDNTAPVVAINGSASTSKANSETTITIPLKIKDIHSGITTNTFTADDIIVNVAGKAVTPTTKTLVYNSVKSGVYSYTLTLAGVEGNGELTLGISAGKIADNAGNTNVATTITTGVTMDSTAFTATITASENSPTNASEITYTIKFNKSVTGFGESDVTVENGKITSFTKVSDSEYKVVVSNTGSTTQTVGIITGSCEDLSGNLIGEVTPITIEIDRTAPTAPSITVKASSITGTQKGSVASASIGTVYTGVENTYLTFSAVDGLVGVSSGVAGYKVATSADANFASLETVSSYNFKAVTSGTTLYVKTIDNVGNLSTDITQVTVKLVTLSVAPTTASVENEKTVKITATGVNAGNITYNSSNTAIATVSSTGVVTAKKVGTVTITATAGNDTSVKATSSVTVTKGKVAIPTATSSLIYNGKEQTGVAEGEKYEVSGNKATNAGKYTAIISLKDAVNYEWSDGTTANKNIKWSIAQKQVTAVLSAKDKTYDGTTTVINGTVSLTGVVTGDVVTATGSFAFATPGVGQNKTVNVTGITLGGTNKANYVLKATTGTTTANITKAQLTTTYLGETITFGGTPSLSITTTGFVNGETAATASGYKAPTLSLTDKDKKAVTVDDLKVDGSPYTGTPEGGNATNYSFKYVSGNLVVNAKALSSKDMSAVLEGTSYTYTGKDITPAVSVKDNGKELEQDTDYTIEYKNNKNSGTATVTITGKGNYSGKTELTFKINKAVLTATYAGETITYGEKPELKVTVTGFVNGENATTTSGYKAPTLSAPSTAVGEYTLIPVAEDADNYTFKCVSGKLIINAKTSVEASLSQTEYTYDENAKTPAVTVIDRGNEGDSSDDKVLVEGQDYTVEYKNNINAGTATVIITLGGTNGNYSGSITKTFTINKAQGEGTVSIGDWIYGNTAKTPAVTSETGNTSISKTTYTGTTNSNVSYNSTTAPTQAGNYTVTVDVVETANYKGFSTSANFTIERATLTPTATAKNKVYDGNTNAQGTISLAGAKNSEKVTATATFKFETAVAGVDKKVNVTNITLAEAWKANYKLSTTTVTTKATITKATGTATIEISDWTYGDTPSTPVIKTTTNEGANTSFEYSGTTASGEKYGPSSTAPTLPGNYVIKATIEGNDNYNEIIITKEISITKRTLTVTATANNKTYDGKTSATGSIVLTGAVNSEKPTATGTFAFENSTAGNSKKVNVTNITLNSSFVSKYELNVTSLTITANIEKALLTATYAGDEFVYGERSAKTTISVTGFVNSENAVSAAGYKAPTLNITDKNDKQVTVDGLTAIGSPYTGTPQGGEATNYKFKYVSGTIVVNSKQLSSTDISASLDQTKYTYDGKDKTPGVTVKDGNTQLQKGTDFTVTYKNNKNAGTATVTIKGTGNYSGELTLTFTISKVKLTPTAETNEKNYDGNVSATGTVTIPVGVNSEVPTLKSSYVFKFANKNAGTNKEVTVTGIELDDTWKANYELTTSTLKVTSTINKVELTATYVGDEFTYGERSAVTTINVTGFVNSETAATAEGYKAPALKVVDKNGNDASIDSLTAIGSPYTGTPEGGEATNYTFNYVSGKIIVNSNSNVEVTISPETYVYDGTAKKPSVKVVDKTTSQTLVSGTHYTVSYLNNTNAGTATVEVTLKGNYEGTITKTFTITRADGEGSVSIEGWVYGSEPNLPTPVSSTNGISAVSYVYTGTTNAGVKYNSESAPTEAGTYTVTATFAQTRNYNETTATADFTISKAVATEPTVVKGLVYTGKTLSGITGGKNCALSGVTSSINAGNYTATATLSNVNNYEWSDGTTAKKTYNWSIAKATLKPSATAKNKVYDGTTTASGTITLQGAVNNEKPTATAKFEFASANAGTQVVNVTNIELENNWNTNYELETDNLKVEAQITQKAIEVTKTNYNNTYDGSAHSIEISTVPSGDNIKIYYSTKSALTSANYATEGSLDKPTAVNAGTTTVYYYIHDENENYADYASNAESNNGTITISKATLTPTVTVNSKVYDATTNGTGKVTLAGAVNNEAPTATGTFTYNNKNVGTGKTVSVSISLDGAWGTNYKLSTDKVSLTNGVITVKSVTVKSISVNNKNYDGTTTATQKSAIVLSGVISGDTVTATASKYSFASAAAGTGKTVTATGITLSGADSGNYKLSSTQATTTANINKVKLTPTVTANSKVYDGTNSGTGKVTLTGAVNSEKPAASATFKFEDENGYVGNNKTVNVSNITLTGSWGTNYQLTTTTGTTTANITKATLTATYTSETIFFGNEPDLAIKVEGFVNNEDEESANAYVKPTLALKDKDGNAVTVSDLTVAGSPYIGTPQGGSATNYKFNYVSGTLTVKENPVSVTVSLSTTSYVYDKTAKKPTVTVKKTGTTEKLVSGTDYDVTYLNNINAGTATVKVTLKGNYSGEVSKNFTINKKALTVKVNAVSKDYDGNDVTSGTISLTGVISGDTVTAVATGYKFDSSTAGIDKTVTATGIAIAGASKANYKINSTTATGKANINKVKLTTATITANNKVYDGTNTASGTITLTGAVNSESPIATGTFTFEDETGTVGTGKIVNVNIALDSAWKTNYELTTTTGTTTADITKATLTATYAGETITYGAKPVLSVKVTGFVNGETAATANKYVAPKITNTNVKVGSYTLKPQGGSATNYTFNYVSGTLKITAKALTSSNIKATLAQEKYTYDGNEKQPTVTVKDGTTTLVSGTDYTVAYKDNINVGIATVVITGKGNYSGEITKVFTIAKANIKVTLSNYSGTYDRKSHTFGLTTAPSANVTIYYSSSTALTSSNYSSAGSTTKPTRTKAGTTTVYYYVKDSSGNYNDYASNANSKNASIKITAKALTSTDLTVALSNSTYEYNKTERKPDVTITDGTYTLVKGTDFSVTYTNNINAGTATVTINGVGNYSGTITREFTITKKSVTPTLTAKNKVYNGKTTASGTINLSGVITGDTVTATSSSIKFANATVGTGKTVTATSITISGSSSANYVLSTQTATATANITKATLTATYAGETITYGETPVLSITVTGFVNGETTATATSYKAPTMSLTDKSGNSVTVSNISVSGSPYTGTPGGGSATNYTFKYVSGKLTVNAKSNFDVTLSGSSFMYTGSQIKPSVTVKDKENGDVIASSNYTVTYSDNIDPGTATVIVTMNSSSNYSGSVTKTFTILEPYYVEYKGSKIVKYYGTLASAISGVTSGNTIEVLKNKTETTAATLASGKTATLDLNGKTVTLSSVALGNHGTLTITGAGTLIGSGAHTVTNSGTLTKSGTSTIENSSTTTYYAISNTGKATLSAGNIDASYRAVLNSGTGKLTVSGANISSKDYAVHNTGTEETATSPAVKVTSGTIESTTSVTLCNDGTGFINLTGGTIKQQAANSVIVNNKGGTVQVSGAKIEKTGTDKFAISNASTGTITITSGTVNNSVSDAIVNAAEGKISISGGTVETTASAQAVKNNGEGTVTTGGGTIKAVASSVANYSTGTIHIKAGTIVSSEKNGIYNGSTGTVILGVNEETPTVSTSVPSVRGKTYGINNNNQDGILKFYDGVIKGETSPIYGTVTAKTTGYEICYGTETIDGTVYQTAVLGPSAPVITAKIKDASGATYTSGTWTNQNVYVQLKSASVGAGIKEYRWSEDGEKTWITDNLTTTSNVGTITFTSARNKEISFRAVDNNNVLSAISKITIRKEVTAPTITVSPSSATACKSKSVTITVADTGGSALSSSNSYQYYLSSSSTALSGGIWTTYKSGTAFTIGTGITGTRYLYVKRVSDKAGNVSTANGTATTVSSVTYQRFGSYVFDNSAPTIEYETNGGTYTIPAGSISVRISSKLTATDTGGSGLNTLKYAWSQSNTTTPTTWTTFTNADTVSKTATGGNWYLWVQITDKAGNVLTTKSNVFTVKYQVKYDANNGTGAPSDQTKTHGTALKLSSTKPTRTGYTFKEWNTKSDGSGTGYSAGASYTANSSVTLYAIWTANNYNITYNYNGAKNYIEPVSSSINITGFTGSTNKCVTLGTINKGNLEAGDKLKVTFTASYSGLTAASGQTASAVLQGSGDVTEWSPGFPRGSKVSWTGTGTDTYTYTTTALTADQIKNNKFTIQLRTDYYSAGTITITNIKVIRVTTKTVSKAYNTTLGTLPTPVESGYTLKGWYTAASDGTKISSTTKVTGNATYYAQWNQNNYEELNSSGTHVKYYVTLAGAMNSVTSGNTIKVLNNRTENTAATLKSGKTATLNLNGKKITTTTNITTITNEGTLTIKDLTGSGYIRNTLTTASEAIISNTGKLSLGGTKDFIIGGKSTETSQKIIYNNKGTLTLNKGTLQQEGILSGMANRYIVYSTEGGNVTISGATIKTVSDSTTSNDNAIAFYGNSDNKFIMTSGTISAKGNAISSHGSSTSESSPAIKITGGTIESKGNRAISNESIGLIYINGSKVSITGKMAGIYNNSSGIIKVMDGTINSSIDGIYNRSGSLTVSGGTIKGDNSAITNESSTLVTITGGTINGVNAGLKLKSGNALIDGAEITAGGTTSDGTYAQNAACILNAGYGTVTITSGNIQPQVGTNYGINNTANGIINVLGGTVTSNLGSVGIKATRGKVILGSKTSEYEGAYVSGYVTAIDLCDSTGKVQLEFGASTDTTVDVNTEITERRPYVTAKGISVKGDNSENINIIFRNGCIKTTGGSEGQGGGGVTRIYPFSDISESQITTVDGYYLHGMNSVVVSEQLTYLKPNSEKDSDEESNSDVTIQSNSNNSIAVMSVESTNNSIKVNGNNKIENIENNEDLNQNKISTTSYVITTDVVEHTETYKGGKVSEKVKGGTITGEDENPHETVLEGKMPQKVIKISPTKTDNEEYEIAKVIIKDNKDSKEGQEIDISTIVDKDGNIELPMKYLADTVSGMKGNKHIEVEFRKKSKVIVKYLEKGTGKVLFKTDEIVGHEGMSFETNRRLITNYYVSNVEISTDAKLKNINTDEKMNVTGSMCADELTIIYWYEKPTKGIIVKHIEIDEKDNDGLTLNSGLILDEELITCEPDDIKSIKRKTYSIKKDDKQITYISVDGPKSSDENVIIANSKEDVKEVTYTEDSVIEVRYYYERQYNLNVEIKSHKETVNGSTIEIKGGKLINAKDNPYETILKNGSNSTEIELKPNDGYRAKYISVNGIALNLDGLEKDNHSVVFKKEYFKNVVNDINIVVEFEKIPAKVIVKYQDVDTKEDLIPNKEILGFVNDKYNEEPVEIEGYLVSNPEPENATGNMNENIVSITYLYSRTLSKNSESKKSEEESCEEEKERE